MSQNPSTESAVRRELLRLALRNSTRSVPLQLVAIGVVVALGLYVGAKVAAVSAGLLGLSTAVWRYSLGRRYPPSRDLSEAKIINATRELEGESVAMGHSE